MNIISAFQKYGVATETVDEKINAYLKGFSNADALKLYEKSLKEIKPNTIVKGKVVNISGSSAIIDIGYKSEGFVPVDELGGLDKVKVGDEVEVYIAEVEGESGNISLSKNQADRMRGWEQLVKSAADNTTITGKVVKKTQGGYLVDVGVLAFLPSSQVDIRKDGHTNLMNQEIECKIIKIDNQRRNVIVSRKVLIEKQREALKKKILSEIKEGDTVKIAEGPFSGLTGIFQKTLRGSERVVLLLKAIEYQASVIVERASLRKVC
jgi:small subunit ribosomal protein S1